MASSIAIGAAGLMPYRRKRSRNILRTYRLPGAMRAGFNLYRTTPQDVADNEAFLREGGKLAMPVLCFAGSRPRTRHGCDRVMAASC